MRSIHVFVLMCGYVFAACQTIEPIELRNEDEEQEYQNLGLARPKEYEALVEVFVRKSDSTEENSISEAAKKTAQSIKERKICGDNYSITNSYIKNTRRSGSAANMLLVSVAVRFQCASSDTIKFAAYKEQERIVKAKEKRLREEQELQKEAQKKSLEKAKALSKRSEAMSTIRAAAVHCSNTDVSKLRIQTCRDGLTLITQNGIDEIDDSQIVSIFLNAICLKSSKGASRLQIKSDCVEASEVASSAGQKQFELNAHTALCLVAYLGNSCFEAAKILREFSKGKAAIDMYDVGVMLLAEECSSHNESSCNRLSVEADECHGSVDVCRRLELKKSKLAYEMKLKEEADGIEKKRFESEESNRKAEIAIKLRALELQKEKLQQDEMMHLHQIQLQNAEQTRQSTETFLNVLFPKANQVKCRSSGNLVTCDY